MPASIWSTLIAAIRGTVVIQAALAWLIKAILEQSLKKDLEAHKQKLESENAMFAVRLNSHSERQLEELTRISQMNLYLDLFFDSDSA